MTQEPRRPELLTIADVARLLVCSEANVYALIESEQLPCVRVGKSKGYRVDPHDLEEFIQARKTKHEMKGGDAKPPKTPRPRLKHIRL